MQLQKKSQYKSFIGISILILGAGAGLTAYANYVMTPSHVEAETNNVATINCTDLVAFIAHQKAMLNTSNTTATADQEQEYEDALAQQVQRCANPPAATTSSFDHSQCQYPTRSTNPPNGCDNSDPCDPSNAAKGGSGDCNQSIQGSAPVLQSAPNPQSTPINIPPVKNVCVN